MIYELRSAGFAAAICLLVNPAALWAQDDTLAIVGGRLIDGYGGTPVHDSVVLVSGNRISAVGAQEDTNIPDGTRVIDADGLTVMPGLIDLHVHFDIIGHSDYDHWFATYESRMRSDILPTAARIMLDAGVTSVRDLGTDIDNSFWLREEINSGRMPGPRPFIAGPFLRKTPTSFVSKDFVDTWVVESPADGRRKVRRLVEMGVDVIKTQDENLSKAELVAIYDEAHKLGMRVATHLFSQKALRTALEAGLGQWDTIEHIGDGAQPSYPDDIVNMIVEQQVAMGPTIMADEGLRQIYLNPELVHDPTWKKHMPVDIYQDIRGSYEHPSRHPLFTGAVFNREAKMMKLRQLFEAGAPFIVSSDSGSRANPHHIAAAREMYFLHQDVGLSPMQAIMAGTRWAAVVLNQQDNLGTIAEGRLADIIVVDGDPLQNLGDLRHVLHVIKDGDVIR
ncbi:MAG: amidohydrolase family protein [Woeseia sp.]